MNPTLLQALEDNKLHLGRMVGFSKSEYRREHPENNVVFNANIIGKTQRKVFWGDLDLTLDSEKLQNAANESGEEFLVLREMDARFGNENKLYSEFVDVAVAKFSPQ